MKRSSIAAAVLLAVAAGGAQAASFTCDYSGGASSYDRQSIDMACSPASLTVNARGGVYDGDGVGNTGNFDESGDSPSISRYAGYGLGVDSGRNDEHTVDNYYGDEYVRFTFSQAVRVTQLTLSRIGDDLSGADADISYLVGALGGSWTSRDVSNMSENQEYTYTFASLAYSTLFRVGAEFGEYNDDFKIRSMVVETQAQVPLPATAALLGLGMFGMGVAARRRKPH